LTIQDYFNKTSKAAETPTADGTTDATPGSAKCGKQGANRAKAGATTAAVNKGMPKNAEAKGESTQEVALKAELASVKAELAESERKWKEAQNEVERMQMVSTEYKREMERELEEQNRQVMHDFHHFYNNQEITADLQWVILYKGHSAIC